MMGESFECNTYAAVVSVASEGLRDLCNHRSRAASLAMSRAADPLLGCGFDDGKAAASRRTPKCPHRAAAGGAGSDENCGLEFAILETKKSGREAAAIGKSPHSYTESTLPNEI